MLTPLASLRTGLELRLGAAARAWLHQALATAAEAPRRDAAPGLPPWERDFAAAGRHCGPHALRQPAPRASSTPDAPGIPGTSSAPGTTPGAGRGEAAARTQAPPDPADAARLLILHAAAPDSDALTRLYEHGTAAERRAVLLALPHLDPPPATASALALTEDALRANDTRLIATALGPYAAAHLDAHQWRHAVLKCLFTGVPLSAVAGLEHRASGDDELARMLEDYARERTAAGREVPRDLHHVLRLARFPSAGGTAGAAATAGDAAARPAAPAGSSSTGAPSDVPDALPTPRSPEEP